MTESGQTALLNNLAYGDNTAIDLWMRYSTTPQNTGLIIGINPHTSLRDSSNPYVSFVAEDKDKLLNDLTTHVGYYTDDDSDTNESWKYTEYPGYYGADGDENYYGNTVSTEFVTTITPSNSYSYSKLRWTIELPADGTYVKADKNITNLSLANSAKAVFGEPVLSDSDNVKVNSGAVYPITAFNETDKFTTLQLIYNLNTVITGDSAITFGLFIDNLYAPKARATEVRFENSAYADDDSYIAIGENSNSAAQGIFSSDAKGYYANENNEYWTYDPENPNRKQ
jgi:hypothetical protein